MADGPHYNGSGGELSPRGIYARLRLLLRLAEAVSSQLELGAMMAALDGVLEAVAPMDGFDLVTAQGEQLLPRVTWLNGRRRAPGTLSARRGDVGKGGRKPLPRTHSATARIAQDLQPIVRTDIAAEQPDHQRFAEDQRLLGLGFRSYVRVGLLVQEEFIGSLGFCRFYPSAFTPEELELLEDAARPIATAVANSLAYGAIGEQHARLHAENLALREEIDRRPMLDEIVGASPALRSVLDLAQRVARTDSTVLLTGETGTGKELVARAIHRHSLRADRLLIKVNCATLPEALVMSELFGHEKGAFTGAGQRRIGRFEAADGGSLLLDEVSELPAETQAALLRVLQEGEFERVGGSFPIRTNVRVIAATNRDLGSQIEAGRFRPDLFYRLNVFPLFIPPLRERVEDIPPLAEYFAAHYAAALGKKLKAIDRQSVDLLTAYSWPGNVRELQNVIERAVILCDGELLRIDRELLSGPSGEMRSGERRQRPLEAQLKEQEARLIEAALAEAGGKVAGPSGAAAKLKMPASTLEYKIRKLKIDKFGFHPHPR